MTIYPPLKIPETLAAGPGPGNTDPRVLERFVKTGVADHMQQDVLRGMIEAKEMLRELWGTKNVYTYGVAGTGFSGVDCVLSMILPSDTVVVFSNGTFSGIDGLTNRMKASTKEDLAADSLNPKPENVITIETPHGKSVTGEIMDKALGGDKPMWAFMAHWETGSGRINDIKGFSDACLYGVPVISGGGFDSTTAKHALAQAIADESRMVELLHIGDHDPKVGTGIGTGQAGTRRNQVALAAHVVLRKSRKSAQTVIARD